MLTFLSLTLTCPVPQCQLPRLVARRAEAEAVDHVVQLALQLLSTSPTTPFSAAARSR